MNLKMSIVKNVLNSVTFRRVLVIFIVGLVTRIIVNYVYDINVFRDYTNVISLVYYGFMASFSGLVYELPKISFNILDIKLVRSAIKVVCESKLLGDSKMVSSEFKDPFDISNERVSNNTYCQSKKHWDSLSKGGFMPSKGPLSHGRGNPYVGYAIHGENAIKGTGKYDVTIRSKDQVTTKHISLVKVSDDKVKIKGYKEGVYVRGYKEGKGYGEIYFRRGDAFYRYPAWIEEKYNRENGWKNNRSVSDVLPDTTSNLSVDLRDSNSSGMSKSNYENKWRSRLLWSFWKQFSSDFSSYNDYYLSFDPSKKISIKDEIKKGISRK